MLWLSKKQNLTYCLLHQSPINFQLIKALFAYIELFHKKIYIFLNGSFFGVFVAAWIIKLFLKYVVKINYISTKLIYSCTLKKVLESHNENWHCENLPNCLL